MQSNHFTEIAEPWWDQRDVYIIGGGQSLKGRDMSGLRARGIVLGVNRAPELVPCDAMFTLDQNLIERMAGSLASWATPAICRGHGLEVYAAVSSDWFGEHAPIPGVRYLVRKAGSGIGASPGEIINGLNSGYGALCLAVKKRARRIFLLGYDLVTYGHFHDGYPWENRRNGIYFARWAARFHEIARELPSGVEVINCNPASAVDAFPRTRYEEIGL